jgi:uncharacterized membrane protein
MPVVGFLALWALHASFQRGDPSPLSYAPILNPLELTQLVTLMTVLWWSWQGWVKVSDKFRWYGWSAVAFVVLNGIIARATHFWGKVSFEFSALWNVARYQASVSITWTVAALLIMVVATRLKARAAWAVGGVLLAAAVVKLFVVDLAGVGTVGRIVSFIVAGLLILLIGYLSPLPPKLKE